MRNAFVLLAAACLLSTPAGAQVRSATDYYFSRSDASLLQVLGNVEAAHMEGCGEGIRTTRYAAALADCEFILRYFPNHPRVLLTVSELCLAWKSPRCNPDSYFEQAIAINPDVAVTYTTKGIYLLRANRVKDAVAALERAATMDPNSVNAQYNLGLAYVEAKDYERANRHAQRAYQLGAPLPGLRDRLKRAGAWKPEAADAAPPASDSAAKADSSTGK